MVEKEKIIKLCELVIDRVRTWAQYNESVDSEDLCGACAIASYTLYRALRKYGLRANYICGHNSFYEGHCWVELDGYVIDLTARQYSRTIDQIYIQTKENYYKKNVPNFLRVEKIFKNNKALKETSSWSDQSPLYYSKEIKKFIKELNDVDNICIF